MFCGKCGTKLKEGAAFCPECGNPVRRIPSGAAGKSPVKPDPEATVRTPIVTPSGRPPVRTVPGAPERPSAGTVPEPPVKKPEKLISTMDSAGDPGQQEILDKNFKPLGDL